MNEEVCRAGVFVKEERRIKQTDVAQDLDISLISVTD
jgi:hypothetical protein